MIVGTLQNLSAWLLGGEWLPGVCRGCDRRVHIRAFVAPAIHQHGARDHGWRCLRCARTGRHETTAEAHAAWLRGLRSGLAFVDYQSSQILARRRGGERP